MFFSAQHFNHMLLKRYIKLSLMIMIALLFSLIAFGNIVSYQYNWNDVQHVLAMDTIANSADHWRAIHSTTLKFCAFILIIVWEISTAIMCWIGAITLWQNRYQETSIFQKQKL